MKLPLEQATDGQPMMAVLVERTKKSKKKKKKKKKKKDGLLVRAIGKLFLGSAAALEQMGDALSSAADKYKRKHEKSREKRRGGWKKDLGRNLASATTKLMSGSAKAPSEFAKAVWKKRKKKKKKQGEERRSVALPVQPTLSADPAPLTVET